MTPTSRWGALAVVALLATAAFSACATDRPVLRATPNEAELSAVIRASGFDGSGGRLELGAPWIQLWTQAQLPAAIGLCLDRGIPVDPCYAAHPVDTRVYAMSAPQRAELYGYYLTFLDRCLVARGFRVGRIPERAAFLTAINDGRPWSPYDGVTVETRGDWYALSDACPPVPADIDEALQPG
jgi:hypothetical protein